jgi:lipoprotein-anchoring transpeptidase ErfK/SrfK
MRFQIAVKTIAITAMFAALANVCVSAQPNMSVRPDENMIGDQPGIVPTPEEEQLPAEYRRQLVFFRTSEQPGTIIVNTSERFLYLVQGNNRAIRYGIGVGRAGFQWHGLKYINRKSEWPDWTPPPEMIARQPYLPRFMAGGPGDYGERMGLTPDWAARIIRLVGNYGEIYERNVGVKSALGIRRGLNETWTAGGIMYAPPIR